MTNKAADKFKKIPEKKFKPEKEKEVKRSKQNKLIDAYNYLIRTYDFRYNKFVEKPEIKLKTESNFYFYDQRTHDNLYNELRMVQGIDIPDTDLRSLIGSNKISEDYDPIADWIHGLPKWDGTERFEQFLRQVQLKDESLRPLLVKYFMKWFVTMVGSLVSEDCYNEYCLVLAGDQGRGKTRFFTSLVPKELRLLYMFTGNFNPKDKDHFEYLGTKILINLDEMATLNRNDVETLKTTMSTRHVTLRRAFGKAPIFLYRKASFCGSNNNDKFLSDQTGNRRWLPFLVHNIDVDQEYDIGLLYAEALALFKKGFNIYMDRLEIKELNSYNQQFRHVPMEEEMIMTHYKVPTEEEIKLGFGIKYMTTTDIINKLGGSDEYKKINVNDTMLRRMGQTLKALGFPNKPKRIPGKEYPIWLWVLKELDSRETQLIRSFNEKEAEEDPI